jgi:hypothetical protein
VSALNAQVVAVDGRIRCQRLRYGHESVSCGWSGCVLPSGWSGWISDVGWLVVSAAGLPSVFRLTCRRSCLVLFAAVVKRAATTLAVEIDPARSRGRSHKMQSRTRAPSSRAAA